MKYPKPRRRQVRTKTIVMTGGLNDVVTSLELKEGELHQCLNYMEMDSPYHGYGSVPGYERYDGKALATDVPALAITDEGLWDSVYLYLGADIGILTDQSPSEHEITNTGVVVNTSNLRFTPGSFYFDGSSYAVVTNVLGGSFDRGFDESFDPEINSFNPDAQGNFTFDFICKPLVSSPNAILFEKPNCWRIQLTSAGFIEFQAASTAVSGYDISIGNIARPLDPAVFTHVSVSAYNNILRLALKGIPCTDGTGEVITEVYTSIYNSSDDFYIGSDSAMANPFRGFLDEIRYSGQSIWVDTFPVPTVRYNDPSYEVINWNDIAREAQRSTISEVPGSGAVLGVHVYDGEVYALRNDGVGGAALYKATRVYSGDTVDDSSSGWTLVDDTFNPDGRLQAINWRFSGSFSDQQVMCMVDGVSLPRIWDGTTMYPFSNTEAAGLPDRQGTPRFAHLIAVFDNRLLLGYTQDDIILSSRTDPRDYTGGFGSQLNIGDELTNLKELPGESMAVFCRNSIKVLKKLEVPTSAAATPDYTFMVENFSRQAGAIAYTTERMLGDLLYADDRGIVTFRTSDKYGDFEAAAISKKLNKTYLAKKDLITTSLVDRETNQYRLYFSDGYALYVTFQEEELKGGTVIAFPKPVLTAAEGKDEKGNSIKVFTSENGYVYKMDSGTSFDGEDISTQLMTAFYHYGSPRYWKRFMRMVFEMTASRGTEFFVRSLFDYDSDDFPPTLTWEPILKGTSGVWDRDIWGNFVWGGAAVQRAIHYVRGTGTNMSIEIRTSNRYNTPHVVHNCIVDYELENLQE